MGDVWPRLMGMGLLVTASCGGLGDPAGQPGREGRDSADAHGGSPSRAPGGDLGGDADRGDEASAPGAPADEAGASTTEAYEPLFDASHRSGDTIVSREGPVVLTRLSERLRVRHNLSPDDFNNFNIDYWDKRYAEYELRDYTSPEAAHLRPGACKTSDPCVVVDLHMPTRINLTDARGERDPNQQLPNLRYHKVYGAETEFKVGLLMTPVSTSGHWSSLEEALMSRELRREARQWRVVMKPDPNSGRRFEAGAVVEFELTFSFQPNDLQRSPDNTNYYGQTFNYVLGSGGVSVENLDPVQGPLGPAQGDPLGAQAGHVTLPHLAESGGAQVRLSFMQHAYNIQARHLPEWLRGRRLLHTDFVTGAHVEQLLPGPQATGGNTPFSAQAGKATAPIRPSCTQCHFLNGRGDLEPGQDVIPPAIIGLGLLEAIPESLPESYAKAGFDGVFGTLHVVTFAGKTHIGRYGWDAGTYSLRHQISQAAHDDMGVTTRWFPELDGTYELSDADVDALVTYVRLVSIPAVRHPAPSAHPGWALLEKFRCTECHAMGPPSDPLAGIVTTENHPFVELANQRIFPGTDLLLHNIGTGGTFRTAPLWGIGLSGVVARDDAEDLRLLHDGSAHSLNDAIRAHAGEARASAALYETAPEADRSALLELLMAL